jgi:hypothetical protein
MSALTETEKITNSKDANFKLTAADCPHLNVATQAASNIPDLRAEDRNVTMHTTSVTNLETSERNDRGCGMPRV